MFINLSLIFIVVSLGSDSPFGDSKNFRIKIDYASSTNKNVIVISSSLLSVAKIGRKRVRDNPVSWPPVVDLVPIDDAKCVEVFRQWGRDTTDQMFYCRRCVIL